MSFDLVVWYEPWPVTGDEARHKLDVAYAGDDTGFLPHPGLRRFRAALLERYPALEDLDPDIDAGVWSVTSDDSDRYISLCMSYSAPDDVITTILDLAAANNLICLDPQDNTIYLPPSLGRISGTKPKTWTSSWLSSATSPAAMTATAKGWRGRSTADQAVIATEARITDLSGSDVRWRGGSPLARSCEVRSFTAWHRHATLVTAAHLFITLLRGDPKADAPA